MDENVNSNVPINRTLWSTKNPDNVEIRSESFPEDEMDTTSPPLAPEPSRSNSLSHSEDSTPLAKLEEEVEQLKLKIRLYEEPPDFDLNEYTVVVNGVQKTNSGVLGVGGHVRYCIQLKNPKVKTSLKVFRRFSDWVVLAHILEGEAPLALLPIRPPKKLGILGSHMDSNFVEQRMIQLHAYTQCLARNPQVKQNQYFRKFLYLPSEQWEELIGNVTSLGPAMPRVNETRRFPSIQENLWKGIEETGKSLFGGLGVFGSRAKVSGLGTTKPHVAKFCHVYDKFVFLESQDMGDLTDSDGVAKQERAMVLQKATDATVQLKQAIKRRCVKSEELGVAFERLSMNEGTQLGAEYFNVLHSLSAALHECYEADNELLRQMDKREAMAINNQAIVQALQQQTLITQGGKRLYGELFEEGHIAPSKARFEKEIIPEIEQAGVDRVISLSTSLFPFIQAQVENARVKLGVYQELLESLSKDS